MKTNSYLVSISAKLHNYILGQGHKEIRKREREQERKKKTIVDRPPTADESETAVRNSSARWRKINTRFALRKRCTLWSALSSSKNRHVLLFGLLTRTKVNSGSSNSPSSWKSTLSTLPRKLNTTLRYVTHFSCLIFFHSNCKCSICTSRRNRGS